MFSRWPQRRTSWTRCTRWSRATPSSPPPPSTWPTTRLPPPLPPPWFARSRQTGDVFKCVNLELKTLQWTLIYEMLQNQVRLYKMLTSAGGILALLQDNPHVRDGASSNDEIRLKVGAFLVLTVSVSRDGFGIWEHTWSVLGLNRGRGQFLNLNKLQILRQRRRNTINTAPTTLSALQVASQSTILRHLWLADSH